MGSPDNMLSGRCGEGDDHPPLPPDATADADDGLGDADRPPVTDRGKGGNLSNSEPPPAPHHGPAGVEVGTGKAGGPGTAHRPSNPAVSAPNAPQDDPKLPLFDPDERTRPLRLRPGEPIGEYLRRVHDAERSRDWGISVPAKLYRVSEIASHFHLTRQTVHNYATIGLITERRRTPGGQRLFDESVFHRLHRICRLKDRYRLHEIRRMLDSPDANALDAPAAAQADPFGPSAAGTAVETREDDPHREA